MAKAPSVKWTREHLLIALNLYCKLPFGQFDRNNPIIIDIAKRMGRTSNSLAMKLSNFASLDPVQRARGIKGLEGASAQDRVTWAEFHNNMASLAPLSEELVHNLITSDQETELDFLSRDQVRIKVTKDLTAPRGPTEKIASVKQRRGQQFFRQTILNAYDVRCCVSGINVPELLTASHILPWSDFPEHRLNPQNGLCLSKIHDTAFDQGFVSFDDNTCLLLSKALKDYFPQPALEQNFKQYEGKPMSLPEKIAEPNREFLAHHRKHIFKN